MTNNPANREPGAAGAILIQGIQFQARHGVSAEERRGTRCFEVDVELRASEQVSRAAATDRLADTIDYLEVCSLVVRTGTDTAYHLIERVAQQIMTAITARFPGVGVVLEVRKLDPPCPGSPRHCAVRLERL